MKRMIKKIFLYLLLFSFFNYIGCYSSRVVDKDNFFSESGTDPIDDFTIQTLDDERMKIIWETYYTINDTLFAKGLIYGDLFGQPVNVKIALANIQHVEVDDPDDLATAGCVIGLTGLALFFIIGIAVATSPPTSCGVES